jgi:hypothetical protein
MKIMGQGLVLHGGPNDNKFIIDFSLNWEVAMKNKMWTTTGLCFVTFLFSANTRADIYMEKTMAMGGEPTKTWVKGLKQRTETHIALFNLPPMILIQRIDKGVQWNINTRDKAYSESPIVLPANIPLPPSAPDLFLGMTSLPCALRLM